jgi:integrase
MRTVQPIRDIEKIAVMKAELMKTGRRNWFLFVLGINTGLRISDILRLKVKGVKGKSYLMIYE